MRYILAISIIFTLGACFMLPGTASAEYDDNVRGWAWGDATGWISFNCTNENACNTSNYGVTIDVNGYFSGYAWSDNFGWINFAPVPGDIVSYPSNPQTQAYYNDGSGDVSGWARICLLADDPGNCTDGVNGWIKLRCDGAECGTSNYGVSIDASGELHGYAWGADGIGWINFNCMEGSATAGDICGTYDYQTIYDHAEEFGYSSAAIDSNNIITVGKTSAYSDGDFDIYITRYNESGTTAWTGSVSGANDDVAYHVEATSDGGYILTGSTRSYGGSDEDLILLKFDGSNVLQWGRYVGGANSDIGRYVSQTSDGGYIVTGSTRSNGGADADIWVMKFNSSGSIVGNTLLIGGASDDIGYAVEETSDGYILVGETGSYGSGSSDIFIVKIASNLGSLTWSRAIGGAGADSARSLVVDSDGRYVVSGYTTFYGAGGEDFLLLKIDIDGTVLGCGGNVVTVNPANSTPAISANNISPAINTRGNAAANVAASTDIRNSFMQNICGTSYNPASVTTVGSSNITFTSATLTGQVTDTGSNVADIVGVDYGLSTAYGSSSQTNVSLTIPPTAATTFNENISALTGYLTYHYRAKVHTIAGWFYGADMTFDSIQIVKPTMATYNASGIATAQATLNGAILANGGEQPNERGYIFTTISGNYDVGATTTETPGPFAVGAYATCVGACDPPNLLPGTAYYFRSYAYNSAGYAYGPQLSFTTDTANYNPAVAITNPGSDFYLCTSVCDGVCNTPGACCVSCSGGVTQPAICYDGPVLPVFDIEYERINDGIGHPINFWLVVDENMDAAGNIPGGLPNADYSSDWIPETNLVINYTTPDPTLFEPNTNYLWKVSLVDSNLSVSGWTGAAAGGFTTRPVCRPDPPINMSISENVDLPPNCTKINIDWDDDASTEIGYEVRWTMQAPVAGPQGVLCTIIYATGLLDARSANTGGNMACSGILNPNSRYNFEVKAIGYPNDGTNDSVWANAGNLTTTDYCNPTLDSNPSFDCECIDLSWDMYDPPADETQVGEYWIYRDVENSGIFNMVGTSSQGVLEFSDCDIMSGRTPYEYYIESKFGSEPDFMSNNISVSQPCPELPTWKESK